MSLSSLILANNSVLLADKPTGDLDPETSQQILDLLEKLAKEQNKTILVVTHNDSIAKWADTHIVISRSQTAMY